MIAKRKSVKEVNVDGFLKAILYNTNVVEIIWDTSIREIEVTHLAKMQQAVFELGGGKKLPLFFTMHEFLGIAKDARKYATSEEGTKYTLATTVLVDDLAKKLLFNFFEYEQAQSANKRI
ncbi:MAG: hypothetical protein IPJ60_03850 [Sphingobacteriaceae bacterium]|nr:hypothetical protein [Sphingobacteriaceae bacterium]